VVRANADLLETIEAIEISNRNFVAAIHHHGEAKEHGIEPSAAARAAGSGAKFPAHAMEHVAYVIVLRHKRSGAHAGGVSLAHTDHTFDAARRHTAAGAGAAGCS